MVRAIERGRSGGAHAALGQLCGFLDLDVATLEDAIAWAERCPAAIHGTVEVRPVMPE